MGITSTPSRNLSHSWRRSGRRAALRRPSGSQHWPTEPRRACPKGPCPRRRRRKPRRASKQYPEADTAMGPPRGASATVRLASLANGAATSMPERAMPAPEAAEAAPRLDCRQASRASRARRRADATTHVLAKKGESTVTPVHAFNLEVHEVDLRGARTRFLLDSLETTLCACGRCVRAVDHDRRVAGRIKSNGDAAAHFVFLQPDLGVAAFPAFSLRA